MKSRHFLSSRRELTPNHANEWKFVSVKTEVVTQIGIKFFKLNIITFTASLQPSLSLHVG